MNTKLYLVIIKSDSQAVSAYDTLDAALGAFYTEMAYACSAKVATTCIIVNARGTQIKCESYEVTA